MAEPCPYCNGADAEPMSWVAIQESRERCAEEDVTIKECHACILAFVRAAIGELAGRVAP